MIHVGNNFGAPAVPSWTPLISGFDVACDVWSRSVPTATTVNSPSSYTLGGSDPWVSFIVAYSNVAAAVAKPPVRNFSSANLSLAIGSSGSDVFSAFTVAAIVRKSVDNSIQCLLSWQNSGGTTSGHLGVMNDNHMLVNNQNAVFRANGPTLTVADGWALLVWTHGFTNDDVHQYMTVLSTGVTSTADATQPYPNWVAPTGGVWRIGNDSFNEPWSGDIAAVAYWRTALNGTQISSLVTDYGT